MDLLLITIYCDAKRADDVQTMVLAVKTARDAIMGRVEDTTTSYESASRSQQARQVFGNVVHGSAGRL